MTWLPGADVILELQGYAEIKHPGWLVQVT